MAFKLKNIGKSISKAASTVAKVAITPVAATAAVSAEAVGARHAASQIVQKTAINKKIGRTELQAVKVGGTAVDVAAAGYVLAAAAPAIASGAGAVGHAAAAGGAGLLGAGKKLLSGGVGLLNSVSLHSPKAPTTAPTESISPDANPLQAAATAEITRARAALRGGLQRTIGGAENRLAAAVGGGAAPSTADAAGGPMEASVGGLPSWVPLVLIGAVLVFGLFGAKGK